MNEQAPEVVGKTLMSGMVTQAAKVDQFEEKLREYFNHPYVVTVNSATSGLTLAFKMLDLPEGSEVLSCPLTCTATNWPIIANGLKLKWVDVDGKSGNIDLDDLEAKITIDTKAIVIIHWAGIPVDIPRVRDIVDRAEAKYGFRIKVVEDCAHAFGSELEGKKIGTFGHLSVFSLQAIKHLTTGDGGLVLCPDEASYNRARILRWFGIDRNARTNGTDFRMEPDVPVIGYKYHMNDINASIGLANLEGAVANVEKHTANAKWLYERLGDLTKGGKFRLLNLLPNSKSAWWIFTFAIAQRDEFLYFAKAKGIMASQVHKRNDVHSCCSAFKAPLPQLDVYEKEYVSVPCGWWCGPEELEKIAKCIEDWVEACNYSVERLTIDDYCDDYFSLYKTLNGVELSTNTISPKRFTDLISPPNVIHVIMRNVKDGSIVGCGKMMLEDKMYDSVAHIEDIIIHPSYQRKGLGTRIMYHLIKCVRSTNELNESTGDAKIYKIVLAAQEKNRNFYTSLGFTSDNCEYKIYL